MNEEVQELEDISLNDEQKKLLKTFMTISTLYPKGFTKNNIQGRFPEFDPKQVSNLIELGKEFKIIRKKKNTPKDVIYEIVPMKVPKEVMIEMIDEDITFHYMAIKNLEIRKEELSK